MSGIENLGLLIHDVARLLRRRFEERGRGYGLSAAQWRVLLRVSKEEGLAQARLADLLEIEPISVSRLLDRMEEGGWVERRADPSDRRIRCVFPTAKSRNLYGEFKRTASDVYKDALCGLSVAEQKSLIHGLEVAAGNLAADLPVSPVSQPSAEKVSA